MERVTAIMDVAPLRREQILNALFRLIARVGYERATVAQIAKEADVARGALQYYFGRKDDVLRSLVRALTVAERQRFEREVGGAQPPAEQLEAALHVLLRTGDPTRREFARNWTAFNAIAARDERLRRWLDDYRKDLGERLAQLLAHGVKKKAFRAIDPQATALTIVAMVDGALAQWADETRPGLVEKSSQVVQQMVERFVLARPPDRGAPRG